MSASLRRGNCQSRRFIDVTPQPGDRYGILTNVIVSTIEHRVPTPVRFRTINGATLIIQLPNLHLRFEPAPPDKRMTICM